MPEYKTKWMALGYCVPSSPSRARVYVWRKLRECGAAHFKPGVALLPACGHSLEQFQELSEKIRHLGGESWVVEMDFVNEADNQKLEVQFRRHARNECRALTTLCLDMMQKLEDSPDGSLKRFKTSELKKALKKYRQLQSFRTQAADMLSELEQRLTQIAETVWPLSGGRAARRLRAGAEDLLSVKQSSDHRV